MDQDYIHKLPNLGHAFLASNIVLANLDVLVHVKSYAPWIGSISQGLHRCSLCCWFGILFATVRSLQHIGFKFVLDVCHAVILDLLPALHFLAKQMQNQSDLHLAKCQSKLLQRHSSGLCSFPGTGHQSFCSLHISADLFGLQLVDVSFADHF